MKIDLLFRRLEIVFWGKLIHSMEESERMRIVIRETLLLFASLGELAFWLQVAGWAATGLVVGFVLGLLVTGVWQP